jgi:hypothetical protein
VRRLAQPSTGPLKTIAAWKAYFSAQGGDPPRFETNERAYDGLRKVGLPKEQSKLEGDLLRPLRRRQQTQAMWAAAILQHAGNPGDPWPAGP